MNSSRSSWRCLYVHDWLQYALHRRGSILSIPCLKKKRRRLLCLITLPKIEQYHDIWHK